MTVDDLMFFYNCKTQVQLHKKISVSRVTLWKWKKKGIPYRTQTAFEVKSGGELKAQKEHPND